MPITNATGSITKIKIHDGTETATVTEDGWLDVKTHSTDKCFAADYAGAQTDIEIITPAAGKKISVRQIYVSTAVDDVNVTLKFETSGNIFFKLYTLKKQAQTGNLVCAEGAVNEGIELTCGAGTVVSVAYDEL